MFFRHDLQNFEPGPDGPKKTGPARFWELIKEELAAVLIVNVLFLVTSIPIVTIPPALFSLHSVLRRIIQDKGVMCTENYFTAFKQNWKKAYGAFFLTAIPMGIAGYGAVFYMRLAMEHPVLLAPFVFCTTVFLAAMLASAYLYGLLCSGWTLRDAAKLALRLGLGKPLRAVLGALCCYGLPLLAVLCLPLSGAYLLLLGFSLPCLLGNFYVRTVLEPYCGE